MKKIMYLIVLAMLCVGLSFSFETLDKIGNQIKTPPQVPNLNSENNNLTYLNASDLNQSYSSLTLEELKNNYAQLKEDYNLLKNNYAQLKEDYNSLENNYAQLKEDYYNLLNDNSLNKNKSFQKNISFNNITKINEDIFKVTFKSKNLSLGTNESILLDTKGISYLKLTLISVNNNYVVFKLNNKIKNLTLSNFLIFNNLEIKLVDRITSTVSEVKAYAQFELRLINKSSKFKSDYSLNNSSIQFNCSKLDENSCIANNKCSPEYILKKGIKGGSKKYSNCKLK